MSRKTLEIYFNCYDCPNLRTNYAKFVKDVRGAYECAYDPKNPKPIEINPFFDVPDFCPRMPI